MELLKLFRSESSLSARPFLAVATMAGLSNALVLTVINTAAEKATSQQESFRYLVLFAVVMALYVLCQRHILFTGTAEVERILHRILIRIVGKLRNTDLEALEKTGRSKIYASLTKHTLTVSGAAMSLVIAAQAAIVVFFTVWYIAWLSFSAFVCFVILAALALTIHFVRAREVRSELDQYIRSENDLFDVLTDLLDGFKEVKMSRRRSNELEADIADISNAVVDLKIRTRRVFSVQYLFTKSSFYLMMAAVVFVLPRFSDSQPEMLTKTVAAILFVTSPIINVVAATQVLSEATAAAKQIRELETDIDSSGEAVSEDGYSFAPSTFRKMSLEGVRYDYLDREGKVSFSVGPIDLEIQRGEVLFVTGGNGSGKTSFLKLLTSLYRPTSGGILLDGVEIDDRKASAYRELFSASFYDFHLFRRFYGLDQVDPGEVESLLRRMGLAEKTRLTEDRFETTDLSTGQRRRLALVMCYLEDRPIWVFDEWAAEQDVEFRQKFYGEILPELKQQGRTVVAITHDDRFYDLDYVDRILKFEDGRLVST